MTLLYGIHDRDAHPQIPSGGWIVDAVLVTDMPPNYAAIRSDINWIVRLNNGWNPNGTIPLPTDYDAFAKRCADFVWRSKGAEWFIIANEPNHRQEYPHGQPITPEQYADCFNRCYQTIKSRKPEAKVLVAAVAPWDVTSGIDWLAYYERMLAAITACDGLAVHGYTHGANPELVWSVEEVNGWMWHFPVIYETLFHVPSQFRGLPVHVTETNQGDNAWVNANSGWVQNAYQAIHQHNQISGTQKIMSLSLYRWRGDKWQIYDKPHVLEDFQAAVAKGYQSPSSGPGPTPEPPKPTPPDPEPPIPGPAPNPLPDRDIDPALFARGVEFDFVSPPAGTGYWRMTKAQHLADAAHQVGPDHHILGRILKGNVETAGVPYRVDWPSGHAIRQSKPDDPNAVYNYDFDMYASLNEYSIFIDDGNPSDKVSGIGMGKDGNPREHTSTWINFEWVIAERPEPPIPPEPPQPPIHLPKLIWPVQGPVTDRFGTPPAKFGQIGHNGIDIAVPTGTPVLAIADGEVMYTGWDNSGYGHYVRIYHPAIRSHCFVAHLSEIQCRVGDRVQQGQTIALSGSTGNSTGPHVHYELRSGDRTSYHEGLCYGYTQGRYDPGVAYALTGSPLMSGIA